MSPPSAMDTSSESESEEPLQKRLAFNDHVVEKTLEKCTQKNDNLVDRNQLKIVKKTVDITKNHLT